VAPARSQGGARQVARFATWSEEIDEMMAERDGRIEDLTRRVEKLENKE
jgi:polyhydroxyalkanoate synthesis regulator phasin